MNYPLKDLAEFTEYDGHQIGLHIRCPNCGALGGVYFRQTMDGSQLPEWATVLWDRTGDTLDTMSLTPSVQMFDHYHGWVRNGELVVDSSFSCTRQEPGPP